MMTIHNGRELLTLKYADGTEVQANDLPAGAIFVFDMETGIVETPFKGQIPQSTINDLRT